MTEQTTNVDGFVEASRRIMQRHRNEPLERSKAAVAAYRAALAPKPRPVQPVRVKARRTDG